MRFRLVRGGLLWVFEWSAITKTRLRVLTAVAVVVFVGAGVPHTSSEAATPLDAHKLTGWFCSSLDGPFDFTKLVKTFPFERLGDVTTMRKPVGSSKEDESTSVVQSAKGETFTVTYGYQYKNDNATSPYGFAIGVQSATRDFDKDPDEFPKAWLESVGKTEFQGVGPVVGMGEKAPLIGYAAYFSYWRGTGMMNMSWMYASDVSKFSAFCQKH
jgi:hypothetical protein